MEVPELENKGSSTGKGPRIQRAKAGFVDRRVEARIDRQNGVRVRWRGLHVGVGGL